MLFQTLFFTLSTATNTGVPTEIIVATEETVSKSQFIDFYQFVPDLMATFLGFGLALFGQWIWEHNKDGSNAKQLKKQINYELKRIREELGVISGISVEPFKLPIWDTCISTGDLKLLNNELQAELFLVYSIIKEFNAWSLMQANFYFENNRLNEALENELEHLKNILLGDGEKSINHLLNVLKGGD